MEPAPRENATKDKADSNHEDDASAILSPPLCPILLNTPLSTSQMMTATTAATNSRKTIQKPQQTRARFFFLLCWRASQESLRLC